MSDIRVGISGWRYVPWRDNFYPRGLIQRKELYFASRMVNSIEINGSFYGLQTPGSYSKWYAETPEDFVFSVKASKIITHIQRLDDVEQPIANFFASGLFKLKHKLGPILWQFPPSFTFDARQFEHFLTLLPHTTAEAKTCAQGCIETMQKPGYLDMPAQGKVRHAVEIRHASFVKDTFITLLRKFRVALVVADTAGKWPYHEDLTSDFVYLRLHGDADLYRSGYTDKALDRWQQRITAWSNGGQPEDAHLIVPGRDAFNGERDVFCYFDNTEKLWAPQDARALLQKLGRGDRLAEPETLLRAIKS